MKRATFIFVLCIISSPLFAFANGPVVRTGDVVSVDDTQVLEGDFYAMGPTVNISGKSNQDAYIAGADVTINNTVGQDLSMVAGTAQIHGEVGDDVRVFGGSVVIASHIKGDVVVFGGTLNILSTASVDGDVLFWGTEATIDGPVNGTIHGSSDTLRINTAVKGNVEYTAMQSLVLGDKADVQGDISYTSVKELIRAQGAVVGGEIRRVNTDADTKKASLYSFIITVIVTLMFTVLTVYVMLPSLVQRFLVSTRDHFGLYGLIGLGTLLSVPAISVLLMVSVIGLVVGIALFALYIALVCVAWVFGVIGVGKIIHTTVFKSTETNFFTPLLGIMGSVLIMLIPVVGGLIMLAVTCVSLGVLAQWGYRAVRVK